MIQAGASRGTAAHIESSTAGSLGEYRIVRVILDVCVSMHGDATAANCDLEVGQRQTLVADHLAGHTTGWSVDDAPVLVDNINDGDELASVWAIVDQADTAVLNKPCETHFLLLR